MATRSQQRLIGERILSVTPRRFGQQECANLMPNGGCLGVRVEGLVDRGQVKRAAPLQKCLLAAKPIRPCRYFEAVVLPLADQPSPKGKPWVQAGRLEARRQYLEARKVEVPEVKLRTCPECGEPLAARQRVCSKCSRKRRLASYRKTRQTKRMSAPQLTAF